ncbi:hypothetical protein TEA_003977 [Camellia sinensis var. sinensis]|uniref:Major facilitator superfamily (MFS) profile domain-containing protein n=1 Tax=Camellia sinensis var. sinensis TaxID=542762 RepID=A0A4S4DB63_CAMSN|nr:hypothetical protein TEA_003977 [Camellia sinensis var. sinensis]
MTGINAIMFYALTLFQTTGFKNDALLLSAVITGIVNVASTFVSIYLVSIGVILLTHLNTTGTMDKRLAAVVVVLVCLYVMCFAWSWGPLAFIFFFFSAWIVVMGLFVVFLVPKTKGVPIDSIVERLWKQHPVWKNFMDDHDPKSKEMA